MTEIPKVYDPKKVENHWSEFWIKENLFHPNPESEKPPFVIVIPPPNVTGSLHMGHALNNTLQDVLIRWKKMSGFETLWVPGTDHGGIATQNVVEKLLKKEKISRYDLGREKFLERMWQWRKESGDTILDQLKKLGCSLDWEHTRFTMDEVCSKAVVHAFVDLYKKGWIYRGKRMVNWCVRCRTALSDIEVEYEERKDKLYYIRYPILSGVREGWQGVPLIVATTRPETMLGDTAVAVHPDDPRYEKIHGWWVQLPLMDREIEVIQDSVVDPKFGTGVVKVTPAHDPVDFEIGERHHLQQEIVIGFDGKMTVSAGHYSTLSREECRKRVLEDLESRKLIEKIEDYTHSVGTCYRCGVIIEPLVSDQWFLKVDEMAKATAKATLDGQVKIFPESWTKPYSNWLANLKDWCLSRQIWWGHRIPVWYCIPANSNVKGAKNDLPMPHPSERTSCPPAASIEKPSKCEQCGGTEMEQEPDVLDTWFSSALWPFSVFGWPEQTADLKKFYPTAVLVTGHEILYLWVARMVMMGLNFMKQIPFSHVFIHGIVRDNQGKKMSKSLGNVIDPLDLMDKYGTDALRFFLTSQSVPGRDMQISEDSLVGARNFANKIWNVSRFVLMNLEQNDESKDGSKNAEGLDFKVSLAAPNSTLELSDRWILSRYQGTVKEVNQSLEEYNLAQASRTLYQFIWSEFCDWYIELSKIRILKENEAERKNALNICRFILHGIVQLLHPFMPFITEEIRRSLPVVSKKTQSLLLNAYPQFDVKYLDMEAEAKMEILMNVIVEVRTIRSEMNVPPSQKMPLLLKVANETTKTFLREYSIYIQHLCKVSHLEIGSNLEKPSKSATAVTAEIEMFVPLEGLIDFEKEKIRLEKELNSVGNDLNRIEQRLANRDFINFAPKEEVSKAEQRKNESIQKLKRIKEHLISLSAE